ncbi:TPA: hypothetical protein ACQ8BD_001258 [Escherichia coli]
MDGNNERAIRLVGSINILRKFCGLRIYHQQILMGDAMNNEELKIADEVRKALDAAENNKTIYLSEREVEKMMDEFKLKFEKDN